MRSVGVLEPGRSARRLYSRPGLAASRSQWVASGTAGTHVPQTHGDSGSGLLGPSSKLLVIAEVPRWRNLSFPDPIHLLVGVISL